MNDARAEGRPIRSSDVVSGPITYGEGHEYRRAGLLERAASVLRGRPVANRFRRAFNLALWLATGGRGLKAVLPEGEVVRLLPSCRNMRWNPEEYRAFRAAAREGATVLDVGANTGSYTVLFAQWVGSRGRVIAFEPVPAICELLRGQVALNGVGDRVEIVNVAIAERESMVDMIAPGLSGINRVVTSSDTGLLNVPAISLDAFCATRGIRPDVIKIDVEGLELEVLRGARQTLASCGGAAVFAEWHPSIWPSRSMTAADLERELAAQGLRAEALREGDEVWNVEGICARLVRA